MVVNILGIPSEAHQASYSMSTGGGSFSGGNGTHNVKLTTLKIVPTLGMSRNSFPGSLYTFVMQP